MRALLNGSRGGESATNKEVGLREASGGCNGEQHQVEVTARRLLVGSLYNKISRIPPAPKGVGRFEKIFLSLLRFFLPLLGG